MGFIAYFTYYVFSVRDLWIFRDILVTNSCFTVEKSAVLENLYYYNTFVCLFAPLTPKRTNRLKIATRIALNYSTTQYLNIINVKILEQ